MKTFRHAGDLGDVVAFMPAMRALGGGVLMLEAANYTRSPLVPQRWCGIDALLKQQPYVHDVVPWDGRPVDVNGNDFRALLFPAVRRGQFKDKSLCDWMLEAHGMPYKHRDTKWLDVQPAKVARVVINRTGAGRDPRHVYRNPDFPWGRVMDKYRKDAVFIGAPNEYQDFCARCGGVPYHKTASLLEAAQVIAGADIFVGNQSVCFWIAEGLKVPVVLEVWPQGPNCLVPRADTYHGFNLEFNPPELPPK